MPYLEKIDERGNLKVWVVDGSYIRSHIDEEFTNFGQHYSFPYIPKDELWIEKETKDDERWFFTDHLLVEHRLMTKGVPYNKALEEAVLATAAAPVESKAEEKKEEMMQEIIFPFFLSKLAIIV